MELTVLADNNTFVDRYFVGEPGLSILVEDEGTKILFDTGYSDVFLRNAAGLGMDLLDVDFIVLSHGHCDHTGGLGHWIQWYFAKQCEQGLKHRPARSKTRLIAHPAALRRKRIEGLGDVGLLINPDIISAIFKTQLERQPFWLTKNVLFLGEIERCHAFEAQSYTGLTEHEGQFVPDPLMDDTALVLRSTQGLVIVTGCSHAGICNIMEYAQRVCGERRICAVVGGLHLIDASTERLQKTANYLRQQGDLALYPCHCTDLRSKLALARQVPLHDVGVGLKLVYQGVNQ